MHFFACLLGPYHQGFFDIFQKRFKLEAPKKVMSGSRAEVGNPGLQTPGAPVFSRLLRCSHRLSDRGKQSRSKT